MSFVLSWYGRLRIALPGRIGLFTIMARGIGDNWRSNDRAAAAALADLVLFDSLLGRLEKKGIVKPGERREIVEEALERLRETDRALAREAAEIIETSFKLRLL